MPKFYEIRPAKYSEIHILYYEAVMLNSISLKLTGNQIENNMRVESFLLHARNIIDFLEGKGHLKSSDFKDSKGKKIQPAKIVSKGVIKRINQHLSHISVERKTIKIQWKLSLLKKEINKNLLKFLKNISPNYFLKDRYKIADFECLLEC